ncbi:hypothetical protein QO034_20510 [Sedimentitalea sp. JM2-8]|uniref:PH domain-containing protein n=1 Tax=Sedimentitalea xiamensis TaxID=3050037 RepID=A0ABT7FJZ2_9RHOB|nr:hypothetical protein [Sedimentitalea xiamensis]MDK3075461.1 hypothetical protein [Sedimentitalea xiamensis]
MENDEVLAVLEASPIRRGIGVATLVAMAALLFYSAATTASGPLWQAIAVVLGAASLWTADLFRRAAAGRVELTEGGLRDSRGETIVSMEDIVRLDRGAFAFKPSNGFTIRTRSPGTRVWRPGLWWRFGHRIGIGGVTPIAQSKAMAELLTQRIAERQDRDAAS